MNGSLAQILESPRLVEFHDQIGRTLAAERAARRRFRDHLDEDRREEFINGEVVEQVPVQKRHFRILSRVEALIAAWSAPRKLGTVGRENALTEFPRNDYCPDLCFWTPDRLPLDDAGDDTRLVFPPPNFAVEVLSPSTERRDRGVKFEDYEAHDVSEYWIIDPEPQTIEQYVEQGGRYQRVPAPAAGAIASVVIRGFEMPAAAAFDDAAQYTALKAIMATM